MSTKYDAPNFPLLFVFSRDPHTWRPLLMGSIYCALVFFAFEAGQYRTLPRQIYTLAITPLGSGNEQFDSG